MKIMSRKRVAWATLLYLGFGQWAFAALPAPYTPTGVTATSGNWLSLIQAYAKEAGVVLGLIIAVAIFLWIAWITISKFNEARAGKAEWGEVGLVAVIATGVMVFTSYLLTAASTVI